MSDLDEKVTKQSRKVIKQSRKVTKQTEKVTEQVEKSNRADAKSNRVRLTAKQQKVLEFCDETPHTAQEILEMIGVKYHTKTLEQYINKLVLAELLRPTTGKSHDINRRYITAHSD